MQFETLYGLDAKGGIKEWSIETRGNTFIVSHGKFGGKIQSKTTSCVGKHIGKSNETSPEEQALLEAEAKWKKQFDKSYCTDIDNIKPMLNPMLAQDYNKSGHRIKFPCIGGFKLDGVRCVASLEGGVPVLKSRGGKVYPTPKHLAEPLTKVLERIQEPLDGELYLHGTPLNEIVSIARNPDSHEVVQLEFHIFDICDPSERYYDRDKALLSLREMGYLELPLDLVFTEIVHSAEQLKAKHDGYVGAGYEGIILRNNEGLYAFDTRSPDLQKYKEFTDSEYKIIDVVQDKDGRGVFVCDCPDSLQEGKKFKVTLKGTHEERQDVWDCREDFIGEWITVKYQGLTPYNVPQFPVGLRIRKCDDDGNPIE